ncbi:MAG: hypothetical protein IKQ71_07310 [Lachnospiraceae bacterium]|nr:hypothetical protein [Lachnospiraceae bacterium]
MAKRNFYVEGSTARVYDFPAVPKERPEAPRREERREVKKKNKPAKRVKRFGALSFIAFSLASIMMLFACANLISLQSEVTAKKKEITALTNKYESLVNDNDATKARIGSDVDLNAIYKIATEDLGMVYPKAGQIVKYNRATEQYVKQYKDVPDVK